MCDTTELCENHTPPVLMKMDFYMAIELTAAMRPCIAYNFQENGNGHNKLSTKAIPFNDDVRSPGIHCINFVVFASTDMSSHSLRSTPANSISERPHMNACTTLHIPNIPWIGLDVSLFPPTTSVEHVILAATVMFHALTMNDSI